MTKIATALARDLVTAFLQDVNVEGVTLFGANPGPSSHGLYLSRAQIEAAAGVRGMSPPADEEPDDVALWFELSRARYATLPRALLEAMPLVWQTQFVALMRQLDATFDWRPKTGRYWVQLKDGTGCYCHDPLGEYRHPDLAYLESIRQKPDAAAVAQTEEQAIRNRQVAGSIPAGGSDAAATLQARLVAALQPWLGKQPTDEICEEIAIATEMVIAQWTEERRQSHADSDQR